MTNITTHQLRMALTDIEIMIGQSVYMTNRHEKAHKYYLRLDVKDKSVRPEYIIENLTRKELFNVLKTIKFFLDLAEKHKPNIIDHVARKLHEKRLMND